MSMLNIMENLAKFLSCKLSVYEIKTGKVLSLNVTAIKFVVEYFNKYPLLGVKGKDFRDWEIVYNMMVSKHRRRKIKN